MKKYIPNILTIYRIVIAFFIPFLFSNHYYLLTILLLIALLTDLFDGYLARKWNAVSILGKVLDVIADKALAILAGATFVIFINNCLVLVLIGELIIATPAIYYLLSRNALKDGILERYQSSNYGKLKTWVLSITLGIAFISYKIPSLDNVLTVFIIITFMLQLITVFNYVNTYILIKCEK